MIILRQKVYSSQGREYIVMNKEKGIKPNQNAKRFNKECSVAVEKTKRKLINSAIDTINNPAGAIAELGKDAVSRPLKTAGKIAVVVPFPGSNVAGIGVMKLGDEINKRVKPLGKLSDEVGNSIENTRMFKKIRKLDLGIIKKRPYKIRSRND